ncbi:HNH endonuclease signature motif containing protein [Arthrobacter sp. N199823]|uniref:HNH endonuclease n=1 Tax=Arthrobacter sp. N199823 TaxID=2058895 RepID=UPI0015E477BD|nr:HNH endonuclease signature motif containing protein [Arthrobacter sp. N199823]
MAKFANTGAVAMSKCQGLLEHSNDLLDGCSTFFDPVMLAQLDAALAHEFAQRDRARVDEATEAVEAALREGRNTSSLAHLIQCVATARSVATKSLSQATLATEVLLALGGDVSAAGFDPEAVGQLSGAVLHDVIGSLEQTKNALAAAQAHAQALFVAQQRLSQARLGTPKEKVGRGIAHQIALARHESPYRGRQLCELSEVLVREMPYCMRAFSQGQICEYKAGIVARETAFLSLEHRQRVDRSICGDLDGVGLLGNRELAAAARKAAYALDPKAFVKRQEKAAGERYVSLRPAADGMTFLSALIPLKQGVRILATLTRIADGRRATGDERSKGQIMADALMHRLIHHAQCNEGAGTLSDHRGVPEGGYPSSVVQQENKRQEEQLRPNEQLGGMPCPGSRSDLAADQQCTTVDQASISLELVMTDRTLFGSDNEPAILVGYDPIPAPIARDMVLGRGSSPRVWLKRLFTHPRTNQLLAMDSHGRLFPEGMKEFLRLHDQRCQTPYCDAPIREYDHIKAYAAGGATSLDNGQGLCSDCNRAKESPGWFSERSDPPAGVEAGPPRTCVNTPTGHRYISTAPPLPGY